MDYTIFIPGILILALFVFISGIRVVRPTERGLIETLGKYTKFALPGFHWVIPVIQRLYRINITEQMVNAEPQEIITNDNLNATV
ncbi:MAG: SPFH domain-containing protein, partial [Lawsonibacter sp.]|nr:SPFH domain-containing protein [Lawsonibacter sp.]